MPDNEKDSGRKINGIRFIVLILGVCSVAAPISCYIAFSFAMNCGVNSNDNKTVLYERNPGHSRILYYEGFMESFAYAAYPIGNLIMLPFLPFLSKFLSVRLQVFFGVLITGALTAAFPILFDISPIMSVIAKVLHGIFAAPTIPLIGYICAEWCPRKEIGLFVGTMTCNSQIAIFSTMAISGVTCELGGWRSIFFLHGIITAIVAVLWFIFFNDYPHCHPLITSKEYHLLHAQHIETKSADPTVPYCALFTHSGILVILIAAIGNYNGITPLIVYSTSIMRQGLNSSEMEISYYMSTCFAVQAILKIFSGILSDKMKFMSERVKLCFFNTISCGVASVLIIIMPLFDKSQKVTCSLLLVVSQAIIGFNSAGFNRAAVIVSGRFAHFIMLLIGTIITVSTIIEPFVVKWRAPEHSWESWQSLFFLHGGIMFVSNVIFCAFTTGKPFNLTYSKS